MQITSTTRHTIRLEITKNDLLNTFQLASGMNGISDWEIKLATASGDKPLNADITGISLIGISEVIK